MKTGVKSYLRLINYEGRNLFLKTLQGILYLLSFIYWFFLIVQRYFLSKRKLKVNIPLISVGNITWGGTGKTPLVIHLGEYLEKKGKKVAILHHGANLIDEVKLLKKRLPQAVIYHSRPKRELVQNVIQEGNADVVLIDDGFQQWGIEKALDIVCLDYNAPWGNGYLIPRGNLREEPQSLGRADLIIFTKVRKNFTGGEIEHKIRSYNPKADFVYSSYQLKEIWDLKQDKPLNFSQLQKLNIAVLTAIAQPESFLAILQDLKLNIIQKFFYPDHYVYKQKDILELNQKLDKRVEAIFITEKDGVKLEANLQNWLNIIRPPFYLVRIGLKFLANEEALYRRLHFLLGSSNI